MTSAPQKRDAKFQTLRAMRWGVGFLLFLICVSVAVLGWRLHESDPLVILETAPGPLHGAAVWWVRHSAPRYGGKRLSEWLRGYESDKRADRLAADRAVRIMGVKALPLLLIDTHAGRDSPDWKYRANDWLKRAHLPQFDVQYAEVKRGDAGCAVVALRDRADVVVPALIKIYRTAHGPHSWVYQCCAVDVLAQLRQSATGATSFLVGEAANTNAYVRESVVRTLWLIHPDKAIAVPVFTMALKDPNSWVVHWADLGLSDYRGEPAQPVDDPPNCRQRGQTRGNERAR